MPFRLDALRYALSLVLYFKIADKMMERKAEESTARFLTCVPQVSVLPANKTRHSAGKTARVLRPGCRIGSVRRSM